MSSPLKFVFFSTLGLACLLGNSVALAQFDSDGVVVPTDSTGVPTQPGTQIPVNTPTGTTTSPIDSSNRFSCQFYNGRYTVMYQPQSQPGQYFAWAAPTALGGGWTPQMRCQAIASRLEAYRPDGLQELQIAVENNENTVCVTTEANASCRIVLTVPRNQDPYVVRNNIFQNLTVADSGQQTTAVNTYRNNNGLGDLYNLGRSVLGGNRASSSRSGINLKPYLDRRDGGTGTRLNNGVVLRSRPNTQTNTRQQPANIRLNPDRFRR
jgi:hypothetical protein